MEIDLTQGKVAQIDDADWPLVSGYRWYAVECNGKFYAQTKEPESNRSVYLHRLIMEAKRGQQVDHISGDSLDCRRTNMRVCTQLQNNRNVGKTRGASPFKGVHRRADGKWQAKIKVDKRTIHLGYFSDPEDAARAYDDASSHHHGEHGRRNFGGEPISHMPVCHGRDSGRDPSKTREKTKKIANLTPRD